jgi:hypothetical protein
MPYEDDRHRVYMYFQFRNGWQCQFLEADLKTPLPRRLQFTSADKVVELVNRGGGIKDQESRLILDQIKRALLGRAAYSRILPRHC